MYRIIIAPWRPSGPDRIAAWEKFVRPHYESTGIELRIVDSDPTKPFSICEANNLGAAGPWDTAMFIGCDCLIPTANILRGFEHAEATQHITLPHDEFYSLSKKGHINGWDQYNPLSSDEMAGRWREWSMYRGKMYAPSGVLMMPRSVWDRIGGYDERFTGWGYEDAALLVAAGEFDRLSGPMYHYWHPSRRSGIDPKGQAVWATEYKHRPPLQRLVDEGRTVQG